MSQLVPENDNIFQAVWDVVFATDLFGSRIWMTGLVPTATPTFPFVSIQPLGDVTVTSSSDGGASLDLTQQFQIDLWQESLRNHDPALPGQLVRALRQAQADVTGGRIQMRFVSLFLIPPQVNETTLHHVITIIVHHTLVSL